MVMKPDMVRGLAHEHFPAFLRQHKHAEVLDVWAGGRQDPKAELFRPRDVAVGPEYDDIAERARAPWLGLVISTVTQTQFLDGFHIPGTQGKPRVYDLWQRNDFDSWQTALYWGSAAHGTAAVTSLPEIDPLTRERFVRWRPVSAKRGAAFYDEPSDEWPYVYIQADRQRYAEGTVVTTGWAVQVIDDEAIHYLTCKMDGQELEEWTYITYTEHGTGVTPVVDYPCKLDLDGRATAEIEPLIPLARRIDQDVFDRLIVQRFGAWKVRYITGLVRPPDMTEEQYRRGLRELKVGDFLSFPGEKTSVGQLDEMDLTKLIAAADNDLRSLSALSQTPPHHLLGVSSNLQAEALEATNAGMYRKANERKVLHGERHERLARLGAQQMGFAEEARAFNMQARWRDMESRSLIQAANALGILATQVGVPTEMLLEKIPGYTDADVERAMTLIEQGAVDKIMEELAAQARTAPRTPDGDVG